MLAPDSRPTAPSIALVHDYLLVLRGAERTFAAMADLWPDAPVFTLLYDPEMTMGRFDGHQIRPSPLQVLGVRQARFRMLLPLFPGAARHLPLDGYDTVVSSSSAFAHGVVTSPGTRHVCYCHSPFRYAWHEQRRALDEVPTWLRPALRWALRRHRRFDLMAAGRVTKFIANSQITGERIRRYWNRDSEIVHPPVDVDRFRLAARTEDFLLLVGELVGHKRPELALEAARRAGRRIKVVGTGPELARLRDRFAGHAEFVGRIDDAELADLYARADALVVPNVEEFGITAVEAQAAGRPVIAIDGGGARETVLPGETGWLVPAEDVDALSAAMRRDPAELREPTAIREHALGFSREAFQKRIAAAVAETG